MSEPIIFISAIYAFSFLALGLLLTMWEFSRLNRREHKQVSKVRHADRLRMKRATVYVPGYSGA